MGTRSLTNFYDDGDLLVTMYRQFDGYPAVHGRDILMALGHRKLVNGMPGGSNRLELINGVDNAPVILTAYLCRDGQAGNFRFKKPGITGVGEEYVYELHGDTMHPEWGLRLTVDAYGERVFDGPLTDFDPDAVEAAA